MLITADQIRAARALKNWSQTDLAERTGLAVPTIANIELGKQMPGKSTIEKIIDAFSVSGIHFTKNGVEFSQNEIFSLIGDGKFKNFLFDALQTLQQLPPKDRVFMAINAEDIATTQEEIDLYAEMLKNKISLKRIVSEKAIINISQFDTKVIQHKYSDDKGAVFLFANKIGFYTGKDEDQEPTTLIVTNARIAEIYRKTFTYMWDSLSPAKTANDEKKGRK